MNSKHCDLRFDFYDLRLYLGCFTAFKAVDGAEFVACGAVFFLLGDGGEVGGVVGGGHGD